MNEERAGEEGIKRGEERGREVEQGRGRDELRVRNGGGVGGVRVQGAARREARGRLGWAGAARLTSAGLLGQCGRLDQFGLFDQC